MDMVNKVEDILTEEAFEITYGAVSTMKSPKSIIEWKEMATHSSVLAWRIPGTVEPGGLPSVGSHRVGHD